MRTQSWPVIAAVFFFVCAPAFGLFVIAWRDTRAFLLVGLSIGAAWFLGIVGVGVMVSLG